MTYNLVRREYRPLTCKVQCDICFKYDANHIVIYLCLLGCCAPNMVQKRGTTDCQCVYPVRVELLLHNVSLSSNWSNEFLDEFASQLNLHSTQFEIVNFYTFGDTGLNLTMDIVPQTGVSFSADEVTTMNNSLSLHKVQVNPVLVGDYNLLNLAWFRPLAPAPGNGF